MLKNYSEKRLKQILEPLSPRTLEPLLKANWHNNCIVLNPNVKNQSSNEYQMTKRSRMKKILFGLIVFIGSIFCFTSLSFGNGFIIGEQDAEAMGGASAFAARASNPSAIFYNPAGITQLDGINMTLGTNLTTVKTTYQKPGGGDKSSTKDRLDTPSYFYATGKINDNLAAGFGFYQPYGLASDWQSDWPGRHIVTYAMLRTFFFNP